MMLSNKSGVYNQDNYRWFIRTKGYPVHSTTSSVVHWWGRVYPKPNCYTHKPYYII